MISIKPRRASEIAEIVSGKLVGKDFIIDKIYLSSKEKMAFGSCFIAIKGEKYDGNDFLNEAYENGATIVITEKSKLGSACIVVENTKKAMLELSKACKGNTKIIGITGSVGKTTVKNMIISVLSQKYSVIGTKENENNEIGVAKTLLKIKNEDFCVVEMGMRALGEIDLLASYALPELAVITNIKTSHIEMLGSKKNILRAKMEILNYQPKYCVLPNDKRLKKRNYGKISTVFIDEKIKKSQYSYFENGIEFTIKNDDGKKSKMKIYSFLLHNIRNAEIAYRVGKIYCLSDEEILKGILEFKQDKMREEYLDLNGITVINDCYNSSFESLKSSISMLSKISKMRRKRSNALIGDILEIGKYSKKLHKMIGKILRKQKIDRLYLYGEHSSDIKKGAGYGKIFDNRGKLIKELKEELNENDVLLVKASRRLKFEDIVEEINGKNE